MKLKRKKKRIDINVCGNVADRIEEENKPSDLIICEGNLVAVLETARISGTDRIAERNDLVAVVKNI